MTTKVAPSSRGLVRAALAFALAGLVAVLSGGLLVVAGSSASSMPPTDECVPAEAYTETTGWLTESPGEGWYVVDERTVVDQEATRTESDWVTESPGAGWVQFDERTVDGDLLEDAYWQRYSWTGGPWESNTEPPPFPDPGWQPNVQGDPHGIGVEGAYYVSHGGSGKGDWFYLEWVDAVYEQVTEYRYYLETPEVSHVEYVFAFDHAAVTCDDEPGEPGEPEEPEVAGEEAEASDQAGTTPVETGDGDVEVLGAQATARTTTVPRVVDAGVTDAAGNETWAPVFVGSGLVLLLTAGATLAGARHREVS